MSTVKRRYPKEDFARRGDAIYQKEIAPKLNAEDNGKFVLVDIDTGDYEIDEDELEAGDRLRTRLPDAQIWTVRVGLPYVHRYGMRLLRGHELNMQIRSGGKLTIKRLPKN